MCEPRSWRAAGIAGLVLSILLPACAPAELPTPSAEDVEQLLQATFPRAEGEVEVRDVSREAGRALARAEYRGADVTILLEAVEGEWEVAGAEMGELTYSVADLRAIGETLTTMRAVSDALEAYRGEHGSYPLLDDQVGLGELVPELYPAAAPLSDAWGVPLRYRVQAGEFNLISNGPDGQAGTPDDILLLTGPGDD